MIIPCRQSAKSSHRIGLMICHVNPPILLFCLPVLAQPQPSLLPPRVLSRKYDTAAFFSRFSDGFGHSFFQQLRVVKPGFLLGTVWCHWASHRWTRSTTIPLWIPCPVRHVPITEILNRLNIPASEEILMIGIIHACGQGGLDLFSCKKMFSMYCIQLRH